MGVSFYGDIRVMLSKGERLWKFFKDKDLGWVRVEENIMCLKVREFLGEIRKLRRDGSW